ncbi:MAG: hypothetical protein RL839_12650 [Gammaproteobacteria bacterium]
MQHTRSEGRDLRLIKPLLLGLFVFLTLGVTIATETLTRFGLEDNYAIVFSVAFVFAVLILSRNLIMIGIVLLGVVVINLPEATLARYHLDQDLLLALVCAIILVPTVYRMVFK